MVWTLEQTAKANAEDVAVGTGVTTTFASTPTDGNELVAWAVARPGNSSLSTNVLSISGWTKIDQRDTSSHSIAVFHKTAGSSEPTGVTLTATMTGDSVMDVVLRIAEYSGGAFGTPDITEGQSTDTSGSSYTETFTPADADARLVVAIASIRQAAFSATGQWDSTDAPSNVLDDEMPPNDNAFSFVAGAGWQEITSASTETWTYTCSASASRSFIIVGWPEDGAGGGATATPSAVSVTASVHNSGVAAGSTVSPSAVSTTASVHDSGVTAGTGTSVTPSPISTTASVAVGV